MPSELCLRAGARVRTVLVLSYRNDHDAAVARIAALERMLVEAHDQAREKASQDRSRIAMLERELADLRRHAPAQPPSPRTRAQPPPPRDADTRAPIDELSMRGPPVTASSFARVVVFAVATGALLYMFASALTS